MSRLKISPETRLRPNVFTFFSSEWPAIQLYTYVLLLPRSFCQLLLRSERVITPDSNNVMDFNEWYDYEIRIIEIHFPHREIYVRAQRDN